MGHCSRIRVSETFVGPKALRSGCASGIGPPIRLGFERRDIVVELVPVFLVTRVYHDLNSQTGCVIHRTEGKSRMVRRPGVRAKNWTAAARAKSFCHLRTVVGRVSKFTYFPTHSQIFQTKHRSDCMARSADSSAFVTMALRHNDRRPLNLVTDGAACASARIYFA